MSIHPKVNGEYKETSACYVKVGGAWKKAKKLFVKVDGVWKEGWRGSTTIVVKSTNQFTIPIKGYDGTTVRNVEIRNLNLRLYNKSTGNLIAEKHYDVVTITSESKPILDVYPASGANQSASFTPHITGSTITVYPTLTSATYVYAEFEYDEVVKV